MGETRRWLWPASHAAILRHESYRTVTFANSVYAPSDFLLPGSDDELSEGEQRAKRRRITKLGQAYLSGRSLFIASAYSRGPFEPNVAARCREESLLLKAEAEAISSLKEIPPVVRAIVPAKKFNPRRGALLNHALSDDDNFVSGSPTEDVRDPKRRRPSRPPITPGRQRRKQRELRREQLAQQTSPALSEATSGHTADAVSVQFQEVATETESVTAEEEAVHQVVAAAKEARAEPGHDLPMKDLCETASNGSPSHNKLMAEEVDSPCEPQSRSARSAASPTSNSDATSPTSLHLISARQSPKGLSKPHLDMDTEAQAQAESRDGPHVSDFDMAGLQQARLLSSQALLRSTNTSPQDARPFAGARSTKIPSRPTRSLSQRSSRNVTPAASPVNLAQDEQQEASIRERAADIYEVPSDANGSSDSPAYVVRQPVTDASRSAGRLKSVKKAVPRRKLAKGGPVEGLSTMARPMKTYQSAPNVASSPFLFRRNKGSNLDPMPIDVSASTETATEQRKSRKYFPFDSSVDQPEAMSATPASPHHEQPSLPDVAPAINMSFTQDSFAMNFDLIDRCTGVRIPASAKADDRSVSLRRAMKESGATFSRQTGGDASSPVDANLPVQTRLTYGQKDIKDPDSESGHHSTPEKAVTNSVMAGSSNSNGVLRDAIEDNCTSEVPVANGSPELSTQAALHEAHRALLDFDSTAQKDVPRALSEHQTPKAGPLSPSHGITPFSEFNQTLPECNDRKARKELDEGPVQSTQAFFDAFSPFAISTVKKPARKKRASFEISPSPSAIEQTDVDLVVSDDLRDVGLLLQDSTEPPISRVAPENGDLMALPKAITTSIAADLPADHAKASNASGDVSVLPALPTSTPSSLRNATEAQRSLPPLQSVRLSDILDSMDERLPKDIDITALLSQETTRSSMRGTQTSVPRRGLVLDWDAASDNSTDQIKPPEPSPSASLPTTVQAVQPSTTDNLNTPAQQQSPSNHTCTQPSLSTQRSSRTQRLATLPQTTLRNDSTGTGRSSWQDAQREPSFDVDATVEEIQNDFLSPWDVESAIKQGGASRVKV